MSDFEDHDEHEVNVYGGNARASMMSDDEISPEEEAFMEGYEHSDQYEADDEAEEDEE